MAKRLSWVNYITAQAGGDVGSPGQYKRAKSKKEERGLTLGVARFQDVPYLQILKPQNQLFLSGSRNENQVQSGSQKVGTRTAPLCTSQPLELPGLSVVLSPTQRGQMPLQFFAGTGPGSKRFTKPTCLVMWG